jgi:hypothetical protein
MFSNGLLPSNLISSTLRRFGWVGAIASLVSFGFSTQPALAGRYVKSSSQFCSPHPKSLSRSGRGTLIRLPFAHFGRRGWGMRADLQKWDALYVKTTFG